MDWYEAYSGEKPEQVDFTSKKWVRVRKDIEFVPGDDIIEPHYKYLEKKIKREDWELFKEVHNHDTSIDDIMDGMVELAELITGGV